MGPGLYFEIGKKARGTFSSIICFCELFFYFQFKWKSSVYLQTFSTRTTRPTKSLPLPLIPLMESWVTINLIFPRIFPPVVLQSLVFLFWLKHGKIHCLDMLCHCQCRDHSNLVFIHMAYGRIYTKHFWLWIYRIMIQFSLNRSCFRVIVSKIFCLLVFQETIV